VAATINIAAYSDALVVLGTAAVVVPLVQRLGISAVIAYLGAGALLGPLGLGTLVPSVPILYWFTVVDAKNVAVIADLGVVFLLFLIGLELSFNRLKAMRRLVAGLGGAQVLLSAALLAAITAWMGHSAAAATIIGASLALSSTAIVLELLSKQGRVSTGTGRATFPVLLAQDIAVVPILMLVSIVGAKTVGSLAWTIATVLAEAAMAIVLIVVVGQRVLRPIFRSVAETGSRELFMAAILFVIVATGVIAALAGLSMALGAFVAGLLLAETEYRKAIEAVIEPFKGLLLGIFFFTVGMGIDARVLLANPGLLIGCVVGLIVVKAIVMMLLARAFRFSWPTAVESGMLLGPGGEFAFVAIGLAATLGVLSPATAAFILAVTSLSMVLIPALSAAGQWVRPRIELARPTEPALTLVPAPQSRHAIVIGFGRVGRVVVDMLDAHRVPYTAIDHNPKSVLAARASGRTVYFGDATHADFLRTCGLMSASGVVITIHTQALVDDVVRVVRQMRPDIPVIVRARDAGHARHLYGIGVTDAVPETIEASLQLSEAVLVGLGLPTGPVIASIHEKREEFRAELQGAARDAGQPPTRSIRARRSVDSENENV
jgi:CPA2 family monovalent cation:H+ antiporter-2